MHTTVEKNTEAQLPVAPDVTASLATNQPDQRPEAVRQRRVQDQVTNSSLVRRGGQVQQLVSRRLMGVPVAQRRSTAVVQRAESEAEAIAAFTALFADDDYEADHGEQYEPALAALQEAQEKSWDELENLAIRYVRRIEDERDGLVTSGQPTALEGATSGAVSATTGGKLGEEESARIKSTHEIGDEDIYFGSGGHVLKGGILLPTDGSGASGAQLPRGGLLVQLDTGEVWRVTAAMVRAYWESEEVNELDTNQGRFAASKGFTPHPGLGPNEKMNCAAYAHGSTDQWVEPEDMRVLLEQHYREVRIEDMRVGQEYLIAQQTHYIKVWKLADNQYKTSETNGVSGVYERTRTTEQLTEQIDYTFGMKLYEKK
ncbi:hypothetical protein LJY25_07555 [Hymenobacter sp. BT175]|uniref:hypothetical protein n=1 Tax=Hymenobacter translucens TaxID=2886507 RepID=UPI001D0DDBA2|nr:hypothetical protein [Hymenobacter translucens]MCC2546297.1 hypothetical protein [Hymenobacter translucens]